jgi:outer membrane lipoprotein-sorting protein
MAYGYLAIWFYINVCYNYYINYPEEIMKKIVLSAVLVFCFSLICAGRENSDGLSAGYPYKSASWKSTTTIKSQEETVSYGQTVFLKGKKIRTEGQFFNRATNEKNNQVIIIDGAYMYSINPEKKQGMKYSLKNPNNPSKNEDAAGKCREAAEKNGSETVDGIKCGRYEYSCKSGDAEIKIIEYRNSSGFAIKTVSTTGGTVTTVTTSDLVENASIPDSKFIPDKDIKFMDMDSMTKGDMKKILKAAKDYEKEQEASEGEKEGTGEEGKEDGDDAGAKIMKDVLKNMPGQ